jgi:hypothetical protein
MAKVQTLLSAAKDKQDFDTNRQRQKTRQNLRSGRVDPV